MNKLSSAKRSQILMSLIEGNSIASTCRMTGAAKMTVLSLIREIGQRDDEVERRGLGVDVDRARCRLEADDLVDRE